MTAEWRKRKYKISELHDFNTFLGSGCDSVGRAVASDSRGPRFESSHGQHFLLNIYCQLYWKDKNKEKRPGIAHLPTLE